MTGFDKWMKAFKESDDYSRDSFHWDDMARSAYEAGRGEAETLRDRFAMQLPADEISILTYQNMSVHAKERLTGLRLPLQQNYPDNVDYQLAMLDFNCAVNAAIRFKYADEMLKQREIRRTCGAKSD